MTKSCWSKQTTMLYVLIDVNSEKCNFSEFSYIFSYFCSICLCVFAIVFGYSAHHAYWLIITISLGFVRDLLMPSFHYKKCYVTWIEKILKSMRIEIAIEFNKITQEKKCLFHFVLNWGGWHTMCFYIKKKKNKHWFIGITNKPIALICENEN